MILKELRTQIVCAAVLCFVASAHAVPNVDFTSTDSFGLGGPAGDQILLANGNPAEGTKTYAIFESSDATSDYNPLTPTTPGATDTYIGMYQMDGVVGDSGDIYDAATAGMLANNTWTYLVAYDVVYSGGGTVLTGADWAQGPIRQFYEDPNQAGDENKTYWQAGDQIQMVPEPGSLALLALGATVLAFRRKRR